MTVTAYYDPHGGIWASIISQKNEIIGQVFSCSCSTKGYFLYFAMETREYQDSSDPGEINVRYDTEGLTADQLWIYSRIFAVVFNHEAGHKAIKLKYAAMLNKTIYGYGSDCSSDDAKQLAGWDAEKNWQDYKSGVIDQYITEKNQWDPADRPGSYATINAIMTSGGYNPVDFE